MHDLSRCTYCDDPADTMDHLVPVSRQTNRKRRGKLSSLSSTVPCCRTCNSLLGAVTEPDIRARAALLLVAYAKRGPDDPMDVQRRIPRLVHVASGFDLGAELERLVELQRQRLAEQAAMLRELERDRQEAIEEARAERERQERQAAELAEARRLEQVAARARRRYERKLKAAIAEAGKVPTHKGRQEAFAAALRRLDAACRPTDIPPADGTITRAKSSTLPAWHHRINN